MDRLNTTFRNHLNISDTIASSITGLSISKIKMISGLTPLEGINLRSLLPDSIQPLVLLSYPASMATSCAAAEGCGIDRIASSRGSAVGYWGTIERKLEGSLSFLEPLSARQAALQKTVVELTENTPLLRKILRPTWLRQAISSSTSPPGTSTTNFPSRVYGKGPKDALFVLFWAVAFTVLRELTMRYILQPLMRQRLEQLDARRRKKATNGKSLKEETGGDEMTASRRRECRLREKTVTRFAEQGWTFTYASTFFTLGVYMLLQADEWPFSSAYLWKGYPHTPLTKLPKFYYLAQLGFWFHQLFVINIEERRKDHWQMYTHHVITITLVAVSYWTNYTRVGGVIMVLMDFCDILLPLAKMFRYLGLPSLTDATFVMFLLSWLVTRQIGFFGVFLSVVFKAPKHLHWVWDPSQGLYVSDNLHLGFQALLAALLVMSCIWFYMACNVAYRVVRGLGAEDTRSDDEGMDLEESDEDHATMKATLRHAIGVSADASTEANGIKGLQSSPLKHLQVKTSAARPDATDQNVRKRR